MPLRVLEPLTVTIRPPSIEAFQAQRLWVLPAQRLAICLTPKAACTSIKFALHAAFGRPGDRYKDTRRRFRHGQAEWQPAEFLKVAPVRHPLERVRSCYADKFAGGRLKVRGLIRMGCRPRMSFDEFCQLVADTPDDRLDKHLVPQHYLVSSPLWGLADRLLRFEDLARQWAWLQGRYPALPVLDRHNASRDKPDWSDATLALIAERYREDLDLLDYGVPHGGR